MDERLQALRRADHATHSTGTLQDEQARTQSQTRRSPATLDELLAQRAVRRRTQRWAKPHALCAELLWVVRPLAGLAAMRVWGTRSWRAWSVPVLLDVISR